MLSTVNSLDKGSGLPYIFVHVSTGHTPFQLEQIGYSWYPVRPVPLFFSCVTPIKPEEKAVQEIYHTCILAHRKEAASEQS